MREQNGTWGVATPGLQSMWVQVMCASLGGAPHTAHPWQRKLSRGVVVPAIGAVSAVRQGQAPLRVEHLAECLEHRLHLT